MTRRLLLLSVLLPCREYEDLREEILGKLEGLTDPSTRERIVERVYRREELYHGDCLSKAPDLLVTWKDFEYNTRRGYGVEGDGLLGSSLDFSDVSAYSSLQKSGTHHVKGIFIADGQVIKNHVSVGGARIIDLAPTILYLLDVSIPEDMDGRVVEEIIEDDFRAFQTIQIGYRGHICSDIKHAGYGKEEEEYIRDKLKGLGYID